MTDNDQNQKLKEDARSFWLSLMSFLDRLTDLQEGIDREGTVVYIKNNKRMKGANAWLLMCSIVIASLGLDLDSPAIIIGAMLISPLMSPILGIGLGIGTNDKDTLIIAMKHFAIAITIALMTSFIYFWINPLGQYAPTREIIDRTEPTLLAGLVAIFGGIAGIISISRKDGSIAMPGVAIATALMPPLCVAGYGLARDSFSIFLNAFYLFFLNSFFIAISTFVMIRYMKFPYRMYQNEKEGRRTLTFIIVVSLLLITPSIFILRKVIQKKQQDYVVARFIDKHFSDNDNPQSVGYKLSPSDTATVLAIQLIGKTLSPAQIDEYEDLLAREGLNNTEIFALQDEKPDLDKLKQEISGYQSIVKKLELSTAQKSKADLKIDALNRQIDSIQQSLFPIAEVNQIVTPLMPSIKHLDYGLIYHYQDSLLAHRSVILVQWAKILNESDKEKELSQLDNYLKNNYPNWHIELQELN